jgi:hypothetical protein
MRKLILVATYPSTFIYTWLISRLVPTVLQVKANTFGIAASNHPQYFQLTLWNNVHPHHHNPLHFLRHLPSSPC